jgi:hypothetical protein
MLLKQLMCFYLIIDLIIFILKPVRRESLLPPIPSLCTWKEYVSSPVGQHPILARELVCKNTTRGFKATVAMVCIIIKNQVLYWKYLLLIK